MSNQDIITVGQATTIHGDGRAAFVAHNASIRPDRYTFANFEELKAYLGYVDKWRNQRRTAPISMNAR